MTASFKPKTAENLTMQENLNLSLKKSTCGKSTNDFEVSSKVLQPCEYLDVHAVHSKIIDRLVIPSFTSGSFVSTKYTRWNRHNDKILFQKLKEKCTKFDLEIGNF
jgi:hypothetical protein